MRAKSPEVVRDAVELRKNGHKPGPQPIPLNPNGAVMSVIGKVLESDAVRIALGSFLEGRQLEGQWGLRITGAELIPMPKERA